MRRGFIVRDPQAVKDQQEGRDRELTTDQVQDHGVRTGREPGCIEDGFALELTSRHLLLVLMYLFVLLDKPLPPLMEFPEFQEPLVGHATAQG